MAHTHIHTHTHKNAAHALSWLATKCKKKSAGNVGALAAMSDTNNNNSSDRSRNKESNRNFSSIRNTQSKVKETQSK